MSEETSQVTQPHLFDLTKITGRKRSEARTAIVLGTEVNRRRAWVMGIGFFPSLLAGLFAMSLLGSLGLLVIPVVWALWYYLVEHQSSRGLGTRTYVAMADKRKSKVGVFMQCGVPVTPAMFAPLRVCQFTTTVARAGVHERVDEAFGVTKAPQEFAPAIGKRSEHVPVATREAFDDIFGERP